MTAALTLRALCRYGLCLLLIGAVSACAFHKDPLASIEPRLHALGHKTLAMRKMLQDYYGASGVLTNTWYRPPDNKAALQFLADKFARAILWQGKFVIGAMGSSVTLGADNCRRDSYTSQLQRLLGPVLKAGGVHLEVRNSAQNGNCGDSHKDQVWCIGDLVGRDVDVVQYSWTYFEAGDRNRALTHERFYRWSLLTNSAVPELLYTNDCSKVISEDEKLLDAYSAYGANFLCMQRGLKRAGYGGKVWGAIGDTLHTTTREGEGSHVSEERRRSLGVVFRNWHPGPLLFQTTSDVLAYYYSSAILLALDELATSPNPFKRWPRTAKRLTAAQLPSPLVCNPATCDKAPACLTFSTPTFGRSKIAWLSGASATWKHWNAKVNVAVPKAEQSLPYCRHINHCGGLRPIDEARPGSLEFRLPRLTVGHIAACCFGKECGKKLLGAHPTYLIDGKQPKLAPHIMNAHKCVVISDHLPLASLKLSKHRLTIRLPAGQRVPPITHVIAM